MASKKFEKGSAEWQFFQEFWKFRQQYYEADNGEEWFSEMIDVGEKIIEKYQHEEFAEFARNLILRHFEDVETRWKKHGK